MKQLLSAVFIFFTLMTTAEARGVISHNCSYAFVPGVKIYRPSTGVILRVCWDKKNLPKSYQTDIDSDCAITHQAGKIDRSARHFDRKWCIKR